MCVCDLLLLWEGWRCRMQTLAHQGSETVFYCHNLRCFILGGNFEGGLCTWFINWGVWRIEMGHSAPDNSCHWSPPRPGDPDGGWNLDCSIGFQLLEPQRGGQNSISKVPQPKTTKIHRSDSVQRAMTSAGFGECREYRLSSDPPPCALLFVAVVLRTFKHVCLPIHPFI